MKTFRVSFEIEFTGTDKFDEDHMPAEQEIKINDPRIRLLKHELGETVVEISVMTDKLIGSIIQSCIFDPSTMKQIRIISVDELP